MAIQKNNKSAFHAPLHPLDSEVQTYGCRYTTPEFCGKNRLPQVCTLVRKDNICWLRRSSGASNVNLRLR